MMVGIFRKHMVGFEGLWAQKNFGNFSRNAMGTFFVSC